MAGAPSASARPGPGSRPAAWPACRSTPPAANRFGSRSDAYFCADLAGRTRRITPCRINHQAGAGSPPRAGRQELRQVAAQGAGRRGVGRAQVDDQHADLRGRAMPIRHFLAKLTARAPPSAPGAARAAGDANDRAPISASALGGPGSPVRAARVWLSIGLAQQPLKPASRAAGSSCAGSSALHRKAGTCGRVRRRGAGPAAAHGRRCRAGAGR